MVVSLAPGAVAPRAGSAVELRSHKRIHEHAIAGITGTDSEAIVAFSGIHDISAALRLVGCTLWAEVTEVAPGEADSLVGFRVFDRGGECWGTVISQPRFSLNQVLEIEDGGTGATILVPWHDSLVVKIDRRAGELVIDPPAGLRELNR